MGFINLLTCSNDLKMLLFEAQVSYLLSSIVLRIIESLTYRASLSVSDTFAISEPSSGTKAHQSRSSGGTIALLLGTVAGSSKEADLTSVLLPLVATAVELEAPPAAYPERSIPLGPGWGRPSTGAATGAPSSISLTN